MEKEKPIGISDSELEMILYNYVLNQGGTLDVNRLRLGLQELIRKNNEALFDEIKALIQENK